MSKVLDLIAAAHGQCRLSVVSTTSLKLSPYNGVNLLINGQLEQIPSAGITISNSGLAASTLYYVYAYMNAGVMALELSTTGHSATNGVEYKTGDTTRALVGMICTSTSPPSQFYDTATVRTCLNWFNRRTLVAATPTVSASTTSSTLVELSTSARITFLSWTDEPVQIEVVGSVSNNSAPNMSHTTSAGIDGATSGAQMTAAAWTSGMSVPAYARCLTGVAEGLHSATAFGSTAGGGTGTWNIGTQVVIRG